MKRLTITLTFVLVLFSLNTFASSLSEYVGKYQAEDFVLEVLDNGKIILTGEDLGKFSGKELSVTERGNTGTFSIEKMPYLLLVTGAQVKQAECSNDKVQNLLIVASGAEGIEMNCLDKLE